MGSENLTRREFVNVAGLAAGGFILASCTKGQPATDIQEEFSTQPPTETPTPTQTPEPSPTPNPIFEEAERLKKELEGVNADIQLQEKGQGQYSLVHISGSREQEIGVYKVSGGQTQIELEKANGEYQDFPADWLKVERTNGSFKFVLVNDKGETLFNYTPEDMRLRQLKDFPYLTLTSADGRTEWIVGESLKNEVSSLSWNNSIPRLEYEDMETGETRSLTPEQRFQEAVFIAYWSLAKARHPSITLQEIRNGTTFTYEDNEGNIQTVDTRQPFRFIWTKTNGPGKRYAFGRAYWFEVDKAGGMSVYTPGSSYGPGTWDILLLFNMMSRDGGAFMRGELVRSTVENTREWERARREWALLLQDLDDDVWENPRFLEDYNITAWGYSLGKATYILWIGR